MTVGGQAALRSIPLSLPASSPGVARFCTVIQHSFLALGSRLPVRWAVGGFSRGREPWGLFVSGALWSLSGGEPSHTGCGEWFHRPISDTTAVLCGVE